jgi:Superinfection immunity protein
MPDSVSSLFGYLLRMVVILAYFVPTMAASRYQHPKQTSILFLNILLGWTIVGWVVALRWALKGSKEPGSANQS